MVKLLYAFGTRRLAVAIGSLLVGFLIATALVSATSPGVDTVDESALQWSTARQIGEASPARTLGSPNPDGQIDSPSRSVGEQDDGGPRVGAEAVNGRDGSAPSDASSVPSSTDVPTNPTSTTVTESARVPAPVVAAPASSATPVAVPGTAPTTTAVAATQPPATTSPPSSPATPTTLADEPENHQAVGAAFTTNVFTNWPIRNTNMDGRQQFVSTPASQIGIDTFIEGSDRSIGLGSVAANKHLGQFRTQCSFSHFNYDDPLVHPGNPGKAHLHMYFGNTQANASSNYRSLRDSGSSTCNGFEGNRSAYWIPAVFDASGNVRIPSRIELYYKSHDGSQSIVEKPPEGLGMVAGRAATNPYVEWGCQETGAQGTNLSRPVQQRQNTIPACSNTATLLAHIKFPQCLSGTITESSGDATSQMQYPNGGYYSKNCPAGTRYITSIEFFIAWNPDNHDGNTSNWWLASDVKPDGTRAPNGSTLHGDWFGAWNPQLMDTIHDNCIARLAECSWDLVDNNRRLTWIEHYGAKNPASYGGRRAIPPSEISEKLCPGDPFSIAEDAAFCGGTMNH